MAAHTLTGRVLLGGTRITPEVVLGVCAPADVSAQRGAMRVEFDAAARAARTKLLGRDAKCDDIFEQPAVSAEGQKLDLAEKRAAAFGLLLFALQPRQWSPIRDATVDALAELLNAQQALCQLEASLAQCTLHVLSLLDLTKAEYDALSQSAGALRGVCTLAVARGQTLSLLADCVAALSAESDSINDAVFAQGRWEGSHSGAKETARNLRMLLNGSQQVDSKADSNAYDFVPQLHGAFKQALTNSRTACIAELNGVDTRVNELPAVLVASMRNLSSTLIGAAFASCRRAGFDVQERYGQQMMPAISPCFDLLGAASSVLCAVSVAADALHTELIGALTTLATANADKIRTQEEKVAAKRAKLDARLAKMPPAKAEKELAKFLKKNSKGAKGLVLGKAAGDFFDACGGRTLLGGGSGTNTIARLLTSKQAMTSRVVRSFLQHLLTAQNEHMSVHAPLGTRDFVPRQMALRQEVLTRVRNVFQRHGGKEIDTPVFEHKETLTGKYGEDSKLIYDLADQGGAQLSLRYDLTVPFARYYAQQRPGLLKRFHIARVYRRDRPMMKRGRYREFFQCDFDIAGPGTATDAMVPDAEVLSVLVEILEALPIGDFEVWLNHRVLLDAMMAVCGVPAEKFRPICSAIDKLDKEPWIEVRREMVEDKGLDADVADRIEKYVCSEADSSVDLREHNRALLQKLREDAALSESKDAQCALDEIAKLLNYLTALGAEHRIRFDMSLARGLDYYTGVIYEAKLVGAVAEQLRVGSVAAGGRYDGLIGMFAGQSVPAVGVSIGVERVFRVMELLSGVECDQEEAQRVQALADSVPQVTVRESPTQVLVIGTQARLLEARMDVCRRLWQSGVRAEFTLKNNPKTSDELKRATETGIPLAVFLDAEQLEQPQPHVGLKNLVTQVQHQVPLESVGEAAVLQLAQIGVSAHQVTIQASS